MGMTQSLCRQLKEKTRQYDRLKVMQNVSRINHCVFKLANICRVLGLGDGQVELKKKTLKGLQVSELGGYH